MVKTIRKVGNSNALLLDKAILELLGLREGGQVNLTVTNGSLIVTPVAAKQVDPEALQDCLDRVVDEWGDVLERLAK
jgi:putative addiction module antidote